MTGSALKWHKSDHKRLKYVLTQQLRKKALIQAILMGRSPEHVAEHLTRIACKQKERCLPVADPEIDLDGVEMASEFLPSLAWSL